MLTKSSPISTQSNLFHSELFSQLDVKDTLIQLANTINWTVFDDAFEQHYSQTILATLSIGAKLYLLTSSAIFVAKPQRFAYLVLGKFSLTLLNKGR
jgi:hypothetical protein